MLERVAGALVTVKLHIYNVSDESLVSLWQRFFIKAIKIETCFMEMHIKCKG